MKKKLRYINHLKCSNSCKEEKVIMGTDRRAGFHGCGSRQWCDDMSACLCLPEGVYDGTLLLTDQTVVP